jgi:hypothetical protein
MSNHAAAAKQVRAYVKKLGLKGKVKGSAGAMTDSVHVVLENASPADVQRVTEFANQYQYGHFDGMNDIYEDSNWVEGMPQVKYVLVRSDYDDVMRQKALDAIVNKFDLEPMTLDNHPLRFDAYGASEDISVVIGRTLGGRGGFPNVLFWSETELAA